MATHRFQPTHYHRTMGTHEPVLHVADGDTIITTTVDAGGRDATFDTITQGGNPQNPGTGNLPQGDQREREQENPVRRPGEREGDRPAPRPDTDPNRRMPQYTDPPAKPEVQSEAE